MYRGICICVLLAVLSAISTGQQTMNEDLGTREIEEQNLLHHPRHIRASSGQVKAFQRADGNGDQKDHLRAIFTRYLQTRRAGPSGRFAVLPSRSIIDPTHQLHDRDYLGWMDFGRRSAEEYDS
ncbi:cholecystokinin [Leptodactylus fuscus]